MRKYKQSWEWYQGRSIQGGKLLVSKHLSGPKKGKSLCGTARVSGLGVLGTDNRCKACLTAGNGIRTL